MPVKDIEYFKNMFQHQMCDVNIIILGENKSEMQAEQILK